MERGEEGGTELALPLLRRLVKILVVSIAVSLGIWVGYVPDYQTSYSSGEPFPVCPVDECFVTYRLVVGNSGWEDQESIEVALGEIEFRGVNVRRTAVKAIPFERNAQGLEFGPLEAGKWVEISVTLSAPRGDIPTAEEVFLGVHPSRGELIRGHPNLLKFGRFLTFWANFF